MAATNFPAQTWVENAGATTDGKVTAPRMAYIENRISEAYDLANSVLTAGLTDIDAANITAGFLDIARATPGALFVISKARGDYGATPGNWPTVRPSSRTDITFDWQGNTNPIGSGPIGSDRWVVTP